VCVGGGVGVSFHECFIVQLQIHILMRVSGRGDEVLCDEDCRQISSSVNCSCFVTDFVLEGHDYFITCVNSLYFSYTLSWHLSCSAKITFYLLNSTCFVCFSRFFKRLVSWRFLTAFILLKCHVEDIFIHCCLVLDLKITVKTAKTCLKLIFILISYHLTFLLLCFGS
jgi:hypothetical protein